MFGKNSPGINHGFCKETREDSSLLGLAYLNRALKEGRCADCPDNGTRRCREHVQESLQNILPSQTSI
ncbi:MAG: hypothetical protein PHH16_03360 [Candidatus Gracilibacteria bacterium]|nr:hypothetical protein [Candidatus Gracilibacteria bacterium]